jgi:hypothetical protein
VHLVPLNRSQHLLAPIVLAPLRLSAPTPLLESITSLKAVFFSNSSWQAMPHARTSRMLLTSDFRPPLGRLLPTRWSDHLSMQTPVRITNQNSSSRKLHPQRLSKVPCQPDNPRGKGPLSQIRPCLTSSRLSMLSLRPRPPLFASLPSHRPISKGPRSHSKTLGRPSSIPSASPWTISSSRLVIPKLLFRRFNRSLSTSLVPMTRHLYLSSSNLKPHLVRSPRSPRRPLPRVVLPQRSLLPSAVMFKHPNPLSGRKSVLLFRICLRAQLSEKKKVRQVRAGAGRDTKLVATVAQDPRSRPRPVPSKCLS